LVFISPDKNMGHLISLPLELWIFFSFRYFFCKEIFPNSFIYKLKKSFTENTLILDK